MMPIDYYGTLIYSMYLSEAHIYSLDSALTYQPYALVPCQHIILPFMK